MDATNPGYAEMKCMIFNAKEHVLTLGNVHMNYITFGTGTKHLVMIQGLNTRSIKGKAFLLACMYRIFAKDYTVYLFDRRDEIYKEITVRELALDIAAAMDALGIKKADIVGVSQGGMIAQYLAIDRPDLVHKLVLAMTLSQNNACVRAVIQHWISLTDQGKMKELVADMAVKMYSQTYVKRYKPLMSLLTLLQKPKDVPRFLLLAKSCLTCSTYRKLHKIQCPVFVIGARNDQIVSGEASEELATKLGCRIYIYEQLGHAAYEEAKDFNQRVYDFLVESSPH